MGVCTQNTGTFRIRSRTVPPPTPVITANHMKAIRSNRFREATSDPDTANTTAATTSNKWTSRIKARRHWPEQLADCRVLPDAIGLRAAIREAMPRQAFQEVVPLREKLSEAVSTPRFFTVLVGIFGVLALALAAVGLYGVVSYTVRQREREMAVRLALGAPPSRVLGLMLRQGMTPVALGLALGLVGAIGVTRIMRSLLFEVSATDPATYVGVAVLLGMVGLLASYLPSRRAASVHPALTLRGD